MEKDIKYLMLNQQKKLIKETVGEWRINGHQIEFIRVFDPNHILEMASIGSLYLQAFPACERRSLAELYSSIYQSSKMFFNLIYENKELVGFTIFWDFDFFYYLEHFAIFPEFRGRLLGKMTIDVWKHLFKDIPMVLEVEPANDELTSRRVSFYERNGFKVIYKDYLQIPYGGNGQELPLWLMCSKSISFNQVLEMEKIIKEQVYYAFYPSLRR